jgi:protein-disulfide isomerase
VRSPRLLLLLGLAGLLSVIAAYLAVSYVRGVQQENAIAVHAEEIFRSPTSFVAGNPAGDVSVVAFFDYNCPYCREGAPELKKLLSEDGKIRLVLKELPVLGPDSEDVARIAQAAIAQGKYFELHERLFTERGRATKEKALRIASELGLDTAKLETDMHSPAVERAIAANKLLADRLEVEGVPFYLVGDRLLPGSDQDLYAELSAGVADIRQHGCHTAC